MVEVITDNLDLWTSALLTKSTAGRGSNGKLEAYGIKKLRELILELAVRGKLVPQDANDEPASVLLGKIAKEKTRLIKEGQLKKDKLLPDISDDERTFELPLGWKWVRFGTIAQHNSGKTLDSGRNTGQLRDYITTSNLYWGRLDLVNIRQMPITDDELEKCTARKGDLLICEGGEAGRAAVWPYDHEVCFQNHVHRARFYGEEIDPYFVYRFFEKLNATGEIDQHRKGVGISNMSSKALALIALPIPPFAEQHRIVAKVDELMALCDQLEQQQTDSIAAHQTLVEALLGTLTRVELQQEFSAAWARIASHFDTLFTSEASIDQLKQTILQLAVMGKLVPQNPNDESAEVLYERIQITRDMLVKNEVIKRVSIEPRPTKDKSGSLPTGWLWSRLGAVFDVRDGTHDTPKYTDVGFPLITSKNIYTGNLSFENIKLISEKDHRQISERSRVDRGDILFAMIGSIGNPVIVDTEREFSIKNVALFKYYAAEDAEPRFLLLYLKLVAEAMKEKSTGGVQSFVSLGFLRNYPFPLPPLAEQHRIVAKVDELMVLCDALKARLADVQTTQLHLADAIVEQAVC